MIENARLFERVTEAKRLMDNIFASIPSGVITTDRNGQITLFNQAAEQILQTPSMLVEGLQLSEAFPQLAEDLQPAIEEVEMHKRDVTEFESELSLSEQGQINLRASLSPLENDDDEMEGLAIVLDDITEQRRLEARDKLFQRYLPPTVIERLPNDPQELRLGGQRQEITILFADIRGFTDFSHQHSPETLVDVLNQYLSIGAEAVLSEEGTLDKMMGDCVIAFFNAPLPQSDHTLRAIRAALKIHEGVSRLHKQVPKSRRLSFGIGISVGDAVVGNVGTAKQMNYTAIGSIVNLANRLEASASPGEILLSRTAYQRVKNQVEAQPVSPQKVETLGQSIKAYKLLKLR